MNPANVDIIRSMPAAVTFVKGKKHVQLQITNTRLEDWIDKQELQTLLHISDRTLHTLRKKKVIPFSFIGGKIYYYLPGITFLLEQNLPG